MFFMISHEYFILFCQDFLDTLAEMEREVLLVPLDSLVTKERWEDQVTQHKLHHYKHFRGGFQCHINLICICWDLSDSG